MPRFARRRQPPAPLAADALSHMLDEELRPDEIVPSIFDERIEPRVVEAPGEA